MAYDAGEEPPTREQLEAAAEMCAALAAELGLPPARVLGHRELEGTGYVIEDGRRVQRKECPGLTVDMDEFRSVVAAAMERPGGPEVSEA